MCVLYYIVWNPNNAIIAALYNILYEVSATTALSVSVPFDSYSFLTDKLQKIIRSQIQRFKFNISRVSLTKLLNKTTLIIKTLITSSYVLSSSTKC